MNKKVKIIISIAIVVIILTSILLYFLEIKIDFLLNDELNVILTPLDYSFTKANNEDVNFEFQIHNNNFPRCKSYCEFELVNLENNELISSDNATLEHNEELKKGYSIDINNNGEGQILYSFEAKCNNIRSLLCLTEETPVYRSSLITVNYELTDKEKELKPVLKEKLGSLLSKLNEIKALLEQNKIIFERAPNTIEKDNISLEEEKVNGIESETGLFLDLWGNEEYIFLNNEIMNVSYNETYEELLQTQNNILDLIESRNQDISNLEDAKDKRNITKEMIDFYINYSLEEALEAEALYKKIYNQSLKIINNEKVSEITLNENLNNNTQEIINTISQYLELITELNETNETYNETNITIDLPEINLINFISAEIPEINITLVEIPENNPQCCIYNECNACCPSCINEEENYPVIFIHGHTFNEENTPEFSMNSFTKMQKKLQDEGFINAGQLDISKDFSQIKQGEWGLSRPVAVRASYYFIRFYDLEAYSFSVQKSERIENYALRLNEIIDLVKYRTNSDKVNIVAHSMGGLVTREYIALFGNEKIDKVTLINTPNHGVSGKVEKLCSVFGSKKECNDMASGSVFLRRLNSRDVYNKTYNIYSIGCNVNDKKGDGIVAEDSAYLEGVENFIIEGKCTDRLQSNLHSNVLDPDLYPVTYEIIRDILK